jgi:hypothetical protein
MVVRQVQTMSQDDRELSLNCQPWSAVEFMVVMGESTDKDGRAGNPAVRPVSSANCFGPISALSDDWLVERLTPANLSRLPIRYDLAGAFRSKLSERRGREHNVVSIFHVDS